MSLKSGKGAHRAPSPLRSPYALGGLGIAVTAAVLATLMPAMASTESPGGGPGSGSSSPPPLAHPEGDWMGSTIADHEATDPDATPKATLAAGVEGVDVSNHQGRVDWAALWNSDVRFAYVKATESTGYKNPSFSAQYNGAAEQGMIRGAYHFALPNRSGGAAQADYFVDNGGGWTDDGITLPPVLDMEYNPYGTACYGLTQAQMVDWIKDFSRKVATRTGRAPVIYTTTSWWTSCTGNSPDLADNPLWLARYAGTPGPLPAGWPSHTLWQYTATGPVVGDHDRFNGDLAALKALATG
ncbi:lysozyme [Streptomyces sp. NA02950]|uniref:lysozyme n=1 Tax=Streptomyces sp. NA02950 TaxID=2742137 RepID=UPI0015927748|nr:lysozyme [Streptomyces sp. NA02950]QKV96784.1 lysozyme [Streptomyces sp. NA02950]